MRISDWSSDVCSSDLWGTGVNKDGNVGVMSTGLKAMTPITLFSSGAKASIYGFAQYYYLKNDNLVAAKAILNSGANSRSHVVFGTGINVGLDRKSTRLNSSH